MSDALRILIVDDHPLVRRGLREVIEEVPGFVVVAECGDGEEALRAIAAERPDLVVLDVDMPRMDGFSVLRVLKDEPERPDIVLLTMHGREDLLRSAFSLGVRSYVVKDGAMLDIVDAIRATREGRPYISSTLSAALLTGAPGTATATGPEAELVELKLLTAAELRILRLIADFKTSKEIAAELGISYRTVENHRTSMAAKLGLSGSHALTKFAVHHRERLL